MTVHTQSRKIRQNNELNIIPEHLNVEFLEHSNQQDSIVYSSMMQSLSLIEGTCVPVLIARIDEQVAAAHLKPTARATIISLALYKLGARSESVKLF